MANTITDKSIMVYFNVSLYFSLSCLSPIQITIHKNVGYFQRYFDFCK